MKTIKTLSAKFAGSVSERLYAERRVEEPGMFTMPADWLAARQVAAAEPVGMSYGTTSDSGIPALLCGSSCAPERSFETSAKGTNFE